MIEVEHEEARTDAWARLLRCLALEMQNTVDKPVLHGLWRDRPETPEGKYLVKRRDGTVVEWPNFTIGARDPAGPAALMAYADAAEAFGMTAGYAEAIRRLAKEFEQYRLSHGSGDPDRGQHRVDDPATIAEMRRGRSAWGRGEDRSWADGIDIDNVRDPPIDVTPEKDVAPKGIGTGNGTEK
jgi:hypothetical protein